MQLWSNGYFGANGYLRRIKCARCARRSQACPYWRTGHSTVHVRCATGHLGGPRSQISNGRNPTALMTWPGHRTCPVCTGLSGAPSTDNLHQWSSLVVEAINTPTTPPFIASKFFQLPTTIQELAFIAKHTKRDQILSQLHSKP
jgi:hypothetical protein